MAIKYMGCEIEPTTSVGQRRYNVYLIENRGTTSQPTWARTLISRPRGYDASLSTVAEAKEFIRENPGLRGEYVQVSEGRRAKIQTGYLYVEQTNMGYGMLEQGGYAERVYRIPYSGTLEDAQAPNEWGVSDIDRCIEDGEVVRKGRLIH